MHHPIVFVPAADKDAANTALHDLLGEGWEGTFGEAQASPTGTEPATEYYAGFPVDDEGLVAVQELWETEFPAGAVYDALPGQTLPALLAALSARGLLRVEPL
jgi:hypothetical protein